MLYQSNIQNLLIIGNKNCFTESGFIIDDDGNHLKSLTLRTGYDKTNPRTEIDVIIK